MQKIGRTDIVFAVICAIFIALSALNLLTWPKLWTDEAVSIEIARNINDVGRPDIRTSPEALSGQQERLQSSGYTVTYPLALAFRIFGHSMVTARVYMLCWLTLFLFLSYVIAKRLFADHSNELMRKWGAILVTLLFVSFASFNDNGRPVLGEIPGLFFLLAALYMSFFKESPYKAGLFLGLAVVSKPSTFILAIPAITIALLTFRKFQGFKDLCKIGLVTILPIAIWLVIVLPKPITGDALGRLLDFYHDPFGVPLATQIVANIREIPRQSTILYFALLLVPIVAWRYISRRKEISLLVSFVLFYTVFAFISYLRSPGWLRYLVNAELLILFVLPYVLSELALNLGRLGNWPRNRATNIPLVALGIIVIFQLVQMTFFSQIAYSRYTIDAAQYVNATYPNKSVAVFDSLPLSIQLDTQRRYNSLYLTGVPILDWNPLDVGERPDILVSAPNNKHLDKSSVIVGKEYILDNEVAGFLIYRHK